MNDMLGELVGRGGGVAARDAVLGTVARHIVDHAVRSGHLVRLFPRTYVDPDRLDEPWLRARAALAYAGPGAALSHLTALGIWDLPGGDRDGPVHVVVPMYRRPRATGGIVVHRRRGFVAEPPEVLTRSGLRICRIERCLVDAWGMLPRDGRRAAVIDAVGARRTTPERVREALDANMNVPGRAELTRLINLLAQGCRSELELFGYERVFVGPGLPAMERNVPVRLGDRAIYLDVYCPAARVNFELDGAKWHASPRDRERDLRRDAALAALGIMVVRFTHDQLVHSSDQVRAQIRAILRARTFGASV